MLWYMNVYKMRIGSYGQTFIRWIRAGRAIEATDTESTYARFLLDAVLAV